MPSTLIESVLSVQALSGPGALPFQVASQWFIMENEGPCYIDINREKPVPTRKSTSDADESMFIELLRSLRGLKNEIDFSHAKTWFAEMGITPNVILCNAARVDDAASVGATSIVTWPLLPPHEAYVLGPAAQAGVYVEQTTPLGVLTGLAIQLDYTLPVIV